MVTNNLNIKYIDSANVFVEKIKGSAIVIDAKEIFWASDINTLFEKMTNIANAERALKTFHSDPDRYSLIICNWELQDRPGIEVLEVIRDFNNSNFLIPFILLIPTSTYDVLIKDISWANELGVNDIISWPFSMDRVVKKMKDMVKFYHNTIGHRALFYTAATQIFEGSFKEALDTLDSYKTLPSSVYYDHYIPFFQGRIAEEKGDIKSAEEYYRKSLVKAGNRNFAHAENSLIELLVRLKRYEESIKEAECAFIKSPLNPQWKLHIARVYLLGKNYKKANEIYNFLVRQNPRYQLHINKMVERVKKEQNLEDKQMNDLSEAQRARIKDLSEKANIYLENKMFDQAIRNYLTMIEIDELNPKKYMSILSSLNYKWYKALKSGSSQKNDYKPLIDAVDYSLEVLRMDVTDTRAKKLLIKIVEGEDEKLLDKILEPRVLVEMDRHVKDYV